MPGVYAVMLVLYYLKLSDSLVFLSSEISGILSFEISSILGSDLSGFLVE